MVYQHQVITLLNNYFESTNSTMRDFAQENRELIAALAEEHEKSRGLENKIEKLSKQLKKEKDNNCFMCARNEQDLSDYIGFYVKECKKTDNYKSQIQHLNRQIQTLKEDYNKLSEENCSLRNNNTFNEEEFNNQFHEIKIEHDHLAESVKDLTHSCNSKDLQISSMEIEYDNEVARHKSTRKSYKQFVENVSQALCLDLNFTEEWRRKDRDPHFMEKFMERAIIAINNNAEQIGYYQEDDEESAKMLVKMRGEKLEITQNYHNFIKDIIEVLTVSSDPLRIVNLTNENERIYACSQVYLKIQELEHANNANMTDSDGDSDDEPELVSVNQPSNAEYSSNDEEEYKNALSSMQYIPLPTGDNIDLTTPINSPNNTKSDTSYDWEEISTEESCMSFTRSHSV